LSVFFLLRAAALATGRSGGGPSESFSQACCSAIEGKSGVKLQLVVF